MTNKTLDLKSRIAKKKTRQSEIVTIEEWGEKILLKGMSAKEADQFEDEVIKGGQLVMDNFRAKLAVRCAYDPDSGERIWSDEEADELGAHSGAVVNKLFLKARKFSGMEDGAVERAEKN
jgi:hypothetical protein